MARQKNKRLKHKTFKKKPIIKVKKNDKKNKFFHFLRVFLLFLFSALFTFLLIFNFKKIKLFKKNKQSIKKETDKKIIIDTKIDKNKLKDYFKLIKSLYLEPTELIEILKNKKEGIQLVDVRDINSFKKEHIKGAVYFSSIDHFKKKFFDKKIIFIIYGNYSLEKRPIELAYQLVKNGFKVKVLTIGYNEFRHLKVYWLPQSQWDKFQQADFIEE